MHHNKLDQNPQRPVFKVLAFEDFARLNSGARSSKQENDDAMTSVNASTSDFFKPTVIETFLVGTEGVDLTPSESHYTTAHCSLSHLDGDVDRWIHGSGGPSRSNTLLESTGIQSSRVALQQRATLTSQSHITAAGWYIFAMLLPVLNFFVQSSPSCPNRSPVRSVADSFAILYHQARTYYRSLSVALTGLLQNHMATNFVAAVLDVILCVYALCFLVLSMYR